MAAPKTPQDHKAKAIEATGEDFTFTRLLDGEEREFTLPAMSTIKAGVLRKIRKLESVDGLFTLVEMVADEDALAALDDMDMKQLNSVLSDWQQHSGVSLGES